MSRLFTRNELKALTLAELFALHAQLTAELPATAPGSAARKALTDSLDHIRREITLRHLPKPGF